MRKATRKRDHHVDRHSKNRQIVSVNKNVMGNPCQLRTHLFEDSGARSSDPRLGNGYQSEGLKMTYCSDEYRPDGENNQIKYGRTYRTALYNL